MAYKVRLNTLIELCHVTHVAQTGINNHYYYGEDPLKFSFNLEVTYEHSEVYISPFIYILTKYMEQLKEKNIPLEMCSMHQNKERFLDSTYTVEDTFMFTKKNR